MLLRSVGFALATVVLCLALGYPIAYYIARYGGSKKHILIALLVIPFFVNYLVRTYAWVALLADEGLVNSALSSLNITETGLQLINTPYAVIGGLVYGYLVFMILPIYASLERMDPSLIEAGKDLFGTPVPDLHPRHAPADEAGDPGRLRPRLPAGGRRLRLRLSSSAGRTPTWSAT